MPDWLNPYVDPWTTPAALWLLIVGVGRLLTLRGRALAALACLSAVSIALWKAWAIGPPTGLLDLSIYTNSARAWLDGGSIFSYHSPVFNLSATYPPIGILPFALLTPFTADGREVLYTTFSLGAIGATAVCAAVLAGVDRSRRLDWSLWAMALAVVTVPVWLTLRQGQINSIIWLLVIGDIVLVRRKSRWAGVGIGAATAIKLIPGVFVLWLIVAGLRSAAVRAVLTALMLTALGWVLDPADSRTYWTDLIWHSDRVGALADARNNSILGWIAHVLHAGPTRSLLWGVLALTVLAIGLWRAVRATRRDDLLAVAVIVGCTGALVSPISWTHHLGFLVLALAAIVPRSRHRGWWIASAIAWLLVVDPGHLGDDAPMSLVRMAAMAIIVLALPIVDGRSSAPASDRAGEVPSSPTEPADAVQDQTARAPSSLSTNS